MSEQENLDLSKVVGLIMENPALIEQISSLARKSAVSQTSEENLEIPEETAPQKAEEVHAEPTYARAEIGQSNRTRLLCALKPYVSKERAKAIDSMISIADILDVMKGR